MDHEPPLSTDNDSGNENPAEKAKLVLEIALFETDYKSQESCHQKTETDKVMIEQNCSNYRVLIAYNGKLFDEQDSQTEIVD